MCHNDAGSLVTSSDATSDEAAGHEMGASVIQHHCTASAACQQIVFTCPCSQPLQLLFPLLQLLHGGGETEAVRGAAYDAIAAQVTEVQVTELQ